MLPDDTFLLVFSHSIKSRSMPKLHTGTV